MVEAFANEVTSERFCEALRFAFIKVQVFIYYSFLYCLSHYAHFDFQICSSSSSFQINVDVM